MPTANNLASLVSLQGFKGLNVTDADPYLEPGQANAASNVNATIIKGALLPERGRIQMVDTGFREVTVIFPCVAFNYQPLYLIQGTISGGGVSTQLYNPTTQTSQPLTGALAFTEAVQLGSVIYTNAGQRLFLWRAADNAVQPNFYEWQYPPPPQFEGTVVAENTTPLPTGQKGLAQGYYWYIFTRTTTMPDESIAETSVYLDEFANNASVIAAVLVNPNAGSPTNSVLITPVGFQFTGTNADGTTFYTNIYRQSTNQAGYFFVAEQTTNTPFLDTSSDQQIQIKAQLEVHRDPPPVGPLNLGPLAIHKSRAWAFVNYADPDTFGIVQTQAWYSNPGRPWEFDNTSQVLLADSDIDVNVAPSTGYVYDQPYGNAPRGMAEIGTILLCFKQREMWAVLGDDQTNFVARTYFGIGALGAITPAVGGCFWVSDSGDGYYFDGSAPDYNSKDIRDFIRPVPGNVGIPPAALAASVGVFSNLTWYILFPTEGYSLGFSTTDRAWTSQLPYAPSSTGAVAFVLANPNYYGGTTMNEVVAGRPGNPGIIDWWFADPNNDLGVPQRFSWTGPTTPSKVSGYQEKQYEFLTLMVPPGTQGSAVVTLQVDSQPPIEWTVPDLSVAPRLLQKSIGTQGALVRGFLASLSISVQGVAGQPAPQVWAVDAIGQLPPDRQYNLRV